MSMINRMLADLESRGAPKPKAGDAELVADRSPGPRRRPPWSSILLIVLAALLVVLAVTLWVQRSDRLLAFLSPADGAETPDEVARAPALVGLSFEGSAARPRLVLQSDGPLRTAPHYSRSGDNATLVLDARIGNPMVPAPPPGQRVFRGLSLEPESQRRVRLRLAVAPEAELEMDVDGRRVTLTGDMPRVDAEAADNDAGESEDDDAAQRQSRADDNRQAASEPESDSATIAEADTAQAGDGPGTDSDGTIGEPGSSRQAGSQATTETASAKPAREQRDNSVTETKEPAGENGSIAADDEASASMSAEPSGDNEHPTLRKSSSLDPGMQASRRYREARRALNSGRLVEARQALARALELNPELHPARDLLTSLMRRAGDADTARRLLEEGVSLAPERVEYAMPYARLLVDTGELERAANVLARARIAGADNAGFHALVAAVAQRRDRHEQAAQAYTRALEIDADNGLWWLGLGIALAATERPQEARAAFREARASGDLGNSLDRWVAGRIEELDGEG